MKMVTHKISTAKPTKTMDDFVKEAQAKNAASQIKTASAQTVTKTASTKEANLANLGDKKAKPFGAKGEEKEEKKEKGEKKEGCDEVTASKEVEIKVAEDKSDKAVETYDAGKKEATEFTNDAEKKPEDPEKKANGGDPKPKEQGSYEAKNGYEKLPSSGQTEWEGKQENNNKPEMPTDKNTKASSQGKTVVSVPQGKYTIVANLKPELKKRTREYWLSLYPADYVDAMIADK